MWSVGSKVWYHEWVTDDVLQPVPCVVVGIFYEDGDPVQGVDLRVETTGRMIGGVDSQDCSPR